MDEMILKLVTNNRNQKAEFFAQLSQFLTLLVSGSEHKGMKAAKQKVTEIKVAKMYFFSFLNMSKILQVSFASDVKPTASFPPKNLHTTNSQELRKQDEELLRSLFSTLRQLDIEQAPGAIEMFCCLVSLGGFSPTVLGKPDMDEQSNAEFLRQFVLDDVMCLTGNSCDEIVVLTALKAAANLKMVEDFQQLISLVLEVRDCCSHAVSTLIFVSLAALSQ